MYWKYLASCNRILKVAGLRLVPRLPNIEKLREPGDEASWPSLPGDFARVSL